MMNYRTFPKAEEKLSILGFGCMRLPLKSESSADIDEKLAKKMIRSAIDRGVNYIDTAYPYHSGNSEPFTAEALQDGYREKVHLATKLPSWLIESREDMDKYLNEQLERLQTDHIDYYLIHGLDKDRWPKLKKLDLFGFMDKAVADGRVRYIGFSFHDDLDTFKTIIDAYDWNFCQIQYNYLDTHEQAGTEGLEYTYERGIGLVVMEPLR
ncbi:MAG: aldo/keto reductase, partial [Spirochaetales bacterium]|nr:aldo/keto reductase [Spirochaetales bacterium]